MLQLLGYIFFYRKQEEKISQLNNEIILLEIEIELITLCIIFLRLKRKVCEEQICDGTYHVIIAKFGHEKLFLEYNGLLKYLFEKILTGRVNFTNLIDHLKYSSIQNSKIIKLLNSMSFVTKRLMTIDKFR